MIFRVGQDGRIVQAAAARDADRPLGGARLRSRSQALGRNARNGDRMEGANRHRLTAADLGEVRELGKGLAVAEGDEDDAVVGEGGHGREHGGLLAAAGGRGGDEDGRVLAHERAGRPELAGRVPEGLPLAGEVAVAGGDAEEERVEVGEVGGREDGVGGLGRGVHLGEDLLRERLGDPGGECTCVSERGRAAHVCRRTGRW